ncbi:MAG TPA: type II toxin-antitoxin system RelE/ParE family toxin [Sphingomonadaceae bacterium]|nr:type II toxin-antitoxin system RelE/ParE family toxin [Sphingomonadaceae bacterium]
MAWAIEFERHAQKELEGLGRETAARIVRTLETRIASLADARAIGNPLSGEWSGYWRYRFGDYRVIARIEDERVTIIVVRVAHRREAYRRR